PHPPCRSAVRLDARGPGQEGRVCRRTVRVAARHLILPGSLPPRRASPAGATRRSPPCVVGTAGDDGAGGTGAAARLAPRRRRHDGRGGRRPRRVERRLRGARWRPRPLPVFPREASLLPRRPALPPPPRGRLG